MTESQSTSPAPAALADIAVALRAAFALPAVPSDADAYSLDLTDDAIDLAADSWTLHLEPSGVTFLALDDEPEQEDPAVLRAAVANGVPAVDLERLAAVAPILHPFLAASPDPLTVALAAMLQV